MLLKLLTLIGVIVTVFGAIQRARSLLGGVTPAPRRPDAEDMVACAQCGAWHGAQQPCACRVPYTP